MTTYTGPEVFIGKSLEDTRSFLNDLSNFEQLFPDTMTYFKAYEDGFTFQLGSMPKVGLTRIASEDPNQIVLTAAGGSIDFKLIGTLKEQDASSTLAQLHFEGDFNPMIRMMVEKPLKQLIEDLSAGLQSL